MPKVKKVKILLFLGIAGLAASDLSIAQSADSHIDQIISDQRARQISRQISDNIARRIASDIDASFVGPAVKKLGGASADGSSLMPDSIWSSFSWSRISDDPNLGTPFDVDIYQTTTGVDKRFGDFYVGATLTYAGTVSEIYPTIAGAASTNGSTHSVGITPYAAYVINKNFFLSAQSGYTYSNTNTTNAFFAIPESESDAYQTEVDLNGIHVVDQWFMKGKIGTRYQHNYNKTDSALPGILPAGRSNLDSWTYLADTEVGYSFKNGMRPYTGVLYEYNDPNPKSNNNNKATSVFYYSAGLDYAYNKKANFGLKVQNDLNNNTIDLFTVALTARLELD